ncbi:MAG: glycerol-3-phosphate dehydrogenase/oxidase [Solirubrobacteraceae bacterium]|nr:glycerol-3-phosphate dehydrogenase/oxidase [Solirubrobacteraceae bacterium]
MRLRRLPLLGDPVRSEASKLTAGRRARELGAALNAARPFDVVVIGGGATGTGVALDAASRGLSTVLVEAHDLAFGTSRWSSKLAHGGLRYLATGDVGVAHESAIERGTLLRIAPHLVRGTPMMLPLLPGVAAKKARLMGLGFVAGDLLRRAAGTPGSELPSPRRLRPAATAALAPSLPTAGLRGAYLMHDGQLTDDARLVVAIARTAAGHGASVLTRVRATAVTAAGVEVRDELTGATGTIAARAVVNATGVWGASVAPELELRPSRGTHVVLDGAALPGLRASLTLPYPGERNRYLLVLPQPDGRIYLGLTDEAVETIEDVPTPQPWEIEEMVAALGTVLGATVDPSHVLGAFAGLRPLLAGTAGKPSGDDSSGARGDAGSEPTATADLSRDHAIVRGEHGLVSVVGGKLTTYRRMAQDAVDAAVDHAALSPASGCRTATLPLIGAAPRAHLAALPFPPLRVARFGTEAAVVAAMERTQPDLAEEIAPGVGVTHAELRFAVEREGALDAADLLDRRFRIGLVPAQREAALPAAEAAIGARSRT